MDKFTVILKQSLDTLHAYFTSAKQSISDDLSESKSYRDQAANSASSAQQEADNASYPANANLYDDEADFLANTIDGQFGIYDGAVWKNNSGSAVHKFDFITRVSSVNELRSVTGYGPNSRAMVQGTKYFFDREYHSGQIFEFDPTSEMTHDEKYIIRPNDISTTDPGRWKALSRPNPFETFNIYPLKMSDKHKGLCSHVWPVDNWDNNDWWYFAWREGSSHGVDENAVLKAARTENKGASLIAERVIFDETGIDLKNGTSWVMDNNRLGMVVERRDSQGGNSPAFIYSDDNGNNWTKVDLPFFSDGFGPYNQVNRYPSSVAGADDGGWILFGADAPNHTEMRYIYTTDNGANWTSGTIFGSGSIVDNKDMVEYSVFRLGNEDKWIMLIRANVGGGENMYISKSTDLINWSTPVDSGFGLGGNTPYGMYHNGMVWCYTFLRGDDVMIHIKADPDDLWNDLTSFDEAKITAIAGEGLMLGYMSVFKHETTEKRQSDQLYALFAGNENSAQTEAQLYIGTSANLGPDLYDKPKPREGSYNPNPMINSNIDSIGSVQEANWHKDRKIVHVTLRIQDVNPSATGIGRIVIDLPFPAYKDSALPSGSATHNDGPSIGIVQDYSGASSDQVLIAVNFKTTGNGLLGASFTYIASDKY